MSSTEPIMWLGGEFYFDFHPRRLRQVPLAEYLSEFKNKDNVQILEIGCNEGQSTLWFIKSLLQGNNSRITCIDPFNSPRYITTDLRIKTDKTPEELFHQNIISKYSDKVKYFKDTSESVLPNLTGPFDIVYVDGCHLEPCVYYDLLLTWPLMRSDSILVLDDYGNNASNPIRRAANRFFSNKISLIETLHSNHMFIARVK
ncbi:class I SAM-dependent methyltransferase [bacterium]|nr:class I SAM-dependent methyltransferase [bacterium]